MDFTRHSPAATTSPTCKSSETSSEEVASSMLNKPWTIRVVSAHHRHDSAHKQRGTDRAGHLTCGHENHAPEAAPINCTTITTKGASSTVRQP